MVPEINYWAVILATLSSMAVGAIWYARPVFGNKWIELAKVDMDRGGNAVLPLVVTLIVSFVTAWVLAGASTIAWHFYGGSYVMGLSGSHGSTSFPFGGVHSGLRRYDSATNHWSHVFGPGLDDMVYAVCADGTETLIGGAFTVISGVPMNGIARGRAGGSLARRGLHRRRRRRRQGQGSKDIHAATIRP